MELLELSEVTKLLLNEEEDLLVASLSRKLLDFESVTKKLQN